MNLARAIGKNTLFSLIERIVRFSVGILMVPVVIYYIGLDGYGIWAIITAITSYMSMGVGGRICYREICRRIN